MNIRLLYKKPYGLLNVITLGMLFLAACSPQASVPVTGGNSSSATDTPSSQTTTTQAAPSAATDTTAPQGTATQAATTSASTDTAMPAATDTSMPATTGTSIAIANTDTPIPVTSGTAPAAGGTAMPATTGTAMPSTTDTPGSGTEASLNVATNATLGQILVGNNDMTLYMFAKDGPNQSNCTGSCLGLWSPLLTQGNPNLGAGVDKTLVGTATLPSGGMVVTYNKMPLYTYSKDTKAGDTTGQKFANNWYVVSPAGKAVGM
jgi:predicted lipoprotein with Yx(FWY)xxD motif